MIHLITTNNGVFKAYKYRDTAVEDLNRLNDGLSPWEKEGGMFYSLTPVEFVTDEPNEK